MTSVSGWAGLLVVTILQVVLGVDNILLISILSRTLPPAERERAASLGVVVAMISRLIILLAMGAIANLSHPFTYVQGVPVSGRSLLMGLGGFFLVAKATSEIYKDIEIGAEAETQKGSSTLSGVLTQIFVLDVIFSLDQVITAVGLVSDPTVQILSVLLSVAVMVFVVKPLVAFLEKHPSVRILALTFLVIVGVSLIGDCIGYEFPRPMLYFAMAYAAGVEMLNLRRKRRLGNETHDNKH